MKIEFNKLVPNDYNPRKMFRGAAMKELKESIAQYGLLEPLVVRPLEDESFEVVAGMRRYFALKELEVDEVECNVMELTDIEAVDVSYIENLQRENLSKVEEANMYLTRIKLIPEFLGEKDFLKSFSTKSKFIQDLSKIYKIGVAEIYNRLSLLILPEVILNAIELEGLPLSVALEITRFRQITEPELREEYMLEIFTEYNSGIDSLSEINETITERLELYKDVEANAEKIKKGKIEALEKRIKETNEALDKTLLKTVDKITEIVENEGFVDIDFSDIEIDEIEEDRDTLTEEERDNIIEKGRTALEWLKSERNKYVGNERFEELSHEINQLEFNLSDITIIKARIKEHLIKNKECPFCFGEITKKIINKREKIFKEGKKELIEQRDLITGLESFVDKSIKGLNKFFQLIEAKIDILIQSTKDLLEVEDD